MLNVLRKGEFDEIQLIDPKPEKNQKMYALFRRELEKEGLPIGSVIYHGPDTPTVVSQLPQRKDKDEMIRSYFLVTSDQVSKPDRVCMLSPDLKTTEIRKKVAAHLDAQSLSAPQIQYAINKLVSEIDRLHARYPNLGSKPDGKVEKIVISRINEIKAAKQNLMKILEAVKKDERIYTYAQLSEKLTTLEKKMQGTGFFSVITKSTGAENIKKIKKDVFEQTTRGFRH